MKYLYALMLLIAGTVYGRDYTFQSLNEPAAPVSVTTIKCSDPQLMLILDLQNTSDYRIKTVDVYAVAVSPQSQFIRGGFGFRQAIQLEPGKSEHLERYDAEWEKIAAPGDDIVVYVSGVEADVTSWKSLKPKEKDWRDTLKKVAATPCRSGK